jgi:hypothetical protein
MISDFVGQAPFDALETLTPFFFPLVEFPQPPADPSVTVEGLEVDEEIEEVLDERLIKMRATSSVIELMPPLLGPFPFPFPFHDGRGPGWKFGC